VGSPSRPVSFASTFRDRRRRRRSRAAAAAEGRVLLADEGGWRRRVGPATREAIDACRRARAASVEIVAARRDRHLRGPSVRSWGPRSSSR
jgi:hypothetical protein